MGSEEKRQVEEALLSIPSTFPAESQDAAERLRNRLLGCLNRDDLVTEQARQLLDELHARAAVPDAEPPVRCRVGSSPYGEVEYLADVGVPTDAEPNRRIRELEQPVKRFTGQELTNPKEAVQAILPALTAALKKADADGVHPKQRDHAWDELSAACGRIAEFEHFSCDTSVGALVKEVLLEVSQNPDPVHDPTHDASFDRSPAWVNPSPRLTAARGLIRLAGHPSCLTPEVVRALKRLSTDAVPAVRFQIVSDVTLLYRSDQTLMWAILGQRCRRDPSRGVLQAAVGRALHSLAPVNIDRVIRLTKAIFQRTREGPGSDKVQELCIHLFTDWYIWRDHPVCRDLVIGIARNPESAEAREVVSRLRKPLTHGAVNPPNAADDAIRHRTVDLILRLLHSARSTLMPIDADGRKVRTEAEEIRHASLLRLVDHIGKEIYFASGAFQDGTEPPSKEERERFYRETLPILNELAQVGLPSTAQHLLETMESFIPVDPRDIFLRIGQAVRAGRKYGYQYESMAADLVAKLVERYLAEYRPLFRDDADCRAALIEMLDIFVGWPKAQRLAYRLEEIFR